MPPPRPPCWAPMPTFPTPDTACPPTSDPSPLHLDMKGTIWSRRVMRGPSGRFEREAADPSFPMFLSFFLLDFLATLGSVWDLSCPTRDHTHTCWKRQF